MTRVRSERASSESVQKLWEQYHATGDASLRDRLVLTLAPMVKYIVYRKAREIPARCEVEDFVSCGLEALMRSIDRYDPCARARRSSSSRGPASTAPCSTSCAATTGRRAHCAAGSATSRGPASGSSRSTGARRPSEELADSVEPDARRARSLARRHPPLRRRLAERAGAGRGRDDDRAHRHALEPRRRRSIRSSARFAITPRSASAPPSSSCPSASARWRCACTCTT